MIRPAPPGERCALLRTRTGAEKRALSSGSALPPPFRTIHVISPSRTERGERGDTSADFPGQPMLSSGRQRKSDFLSLEYSSRAHTTAARGQGATDEQIEALKKRGCSEPEVFSKEERCAIRFAEKLTSWPGSLQQSDLDELATCFEAEQIVELVLIIGMVNLTNRFHEDLRTPIDV